MSETHADKSVSERREENVQGPTPVAADLPSATTSTSTGAVDSTSKSAAQAGDIPHPHPHLTPILSNPTMSPSEPAPVAEDAVSIHTAEGEKESKFTDLVRNISVEASVGPIALYAPRSRSASVTSHASHVSHASRARSSSNATAPPPGRGVSFPVAVDEHERARTERTKRGPALPRIDSEKTLAPSDDEHEHENPLRKLAKYRSRDSGVSAAPSDQSKEEKPQCDEKEDLDKNAVDPAPEEPEEPAPRLSKTRKILLGMVTMLNVLIASMSSNAVVLTIPSLADDLNVSQLEAQWVSSAYSLAYGCGLLFAGRLADIFGRKKLFLGGVAVAAAFFFVCGGMRNLIGLCVVRALCGLGLAVSTPSAFGIVGINFREEPERTILFSVLGLGNPIGASVGMLVGGGVAGAAKQGWQYLYFVLGGLALIPLVVGFWVLPPEPKRTQPVDKRIDWLGGFLITAALCLFTFSITESGVAPRGWSTPYVGALLGVSIVLFAGFGWWERRVENKLSFPPIVKLSLFTRNKGTVSIVLLASFLPFVAVSGWVYLVSLFYQELKGMSPLGNAIHTLPASLAGTLAALGVMWIVPRVRAPFIFMSGGFLSGLACLLFAIEPAGTTYWACEFISMLLLPFGADLTVGIGSILMSNLCEDDEQSVAGALFQTATQIASALGICLSSLVQHDVAARTGDYYTGLRHAFGMTTAWAWAVVLLAAVFLRKMGLARHVGHQRGAAAH